MVGSAPGHQKRTVQHFKCIAHRRDEEEIRNSALHFSLDVQYLLDAVVGRLITMAAEVTPKQPFCGKWSVL